MARRSGNAAGPRPADVPRVGSCGDAAAVIPVTFSAPRPRLTGSGSCPAPTAAASPAPGAVRVQRNLRVALLVQLDHADAALGIAGRLLATEIGLVPVKRFTAEAAFSRRSARFNGISGSRALSIRLSTSRPSPVLARQTRRSANTCCCHCRPLLAGNEGHSAGACAAAWAAANSRLDNTTSANFMHPQGGRSCGSTRWTGGCGIPSPDAAPPGVCTDGQLNLNGT